ncbi:MAG: ABC transporter permease subunit [Candidatus Lokiarchaeota archaeon]|nr:ABC transporter permease subunit [Candidatus Lokiarchaeota archaeon]
MVEILRKLDRAFSTKKARKFGDVISLIVFLIIIIIPILYVFTYVFQEWDDVAFWIFNNPVSGNTRFVNMGTALMRSLMISGITVLIDILIGLPMAIILVKYNFKGKKILDTLVDLPMAVPTAALGFSILLFWGSDTGIAWIFGMNEGLISPGVLMIILTHVVFTYPYITRNIKVILMNLDETLEKAGQTLGAQKFTVFRTITAPLMKEGLIAGAILAFTRSLGETGATLIVYGVAETAPIQIVTLKGQALFGPAAFLAMILVIIAIFLLILIKTITRKVGLPYYRVFVNAEKFISKPFFKRLRDAFTIFFFGILILIPALYSLTYLGTHLTGPQGAINQVFFRADNKWASLWVSLMNSLSIAAIATLINIVLGLAMAFIIVRRKWGKINGILDTLVDLPLSIPSSALGLSIFLFWGTIGPFRAIGGLLTPGYFLIVIVHVVFTFPYCTRVIIASLEGLDPGYEEASRTLGATSFTTFRKVTLPLLKNALLAGSIMVFTRSLGETGATFVVMGLVRTIPVTIVDWVESIDLPSAAFASFILIALSFVLILVLRYITEKEKILQIKT